jgi:hypothetical protein
MDEHNLINHRIAELEKHVAIFNIIVKGDGLPGLQGRTEAVENAIKRFLDNEKEKTKFWRSLGVGVVLLLIGNFITIIIMVVK